MKSGKGINNVSQHRQYNPLKDDFNGINWKENDSTGLIGIWRMKLSRPVPF